MQNKGDITCFCLESGMGEDEVKGVLDNLTNMHKRVTGIETDTKSIWKSTQGY